MAFSALFTLAIAAVVSVAQAQSLTVVNSCSESVFLFTQNSYGTIDNDVTVAAGASVDMGISSNWDGAINVGTGCNSDGSSCTTGGPTWNGVTPFSRAEFNFWAIPGSVTYDISLIYGYSVGMMISSADASCDAFACTITGCPVPGPGDDTCYSPCCSSASACANGALPLGGGGCTNNAGPGPNSPFYYNSCFNAYAFPDNDGADGYTPADFVDYTCGNTDITLTLCPGTTSHYTA
ncbi:Osmotin thaumatin-like protein [Coniophora puteana RWD-64-598 SS2]|uniref:Osmotin thaumatin-like protein n=1 Tax=Coniophora puteana (strain RWD-64-598) TaxID=741705 RepID=A0A5M3MLH4_CONPW|nr:Osmotin thaumatin-like protein [Coniophora puteana RWD-64-598 SS2]EIW80079.1 Osmotin thaumatin-like protein [Coniophora puteana RWD-64-598 SS2]